MQARPLWTCGLLLMVLAWLAPSAWALDRHLTVIIDTSASMQDSDPRRYTVQLTRILADLLDKGDSLTVIRMPRYEKRSCADPADLGLARSVEDPAELSSFKQGLDSLLVYDTGTYFAAPIRTAREDLNQHADKPRLLLIIADSGGLGACQEPLTQELLVLRANGVVIAAVNLGAGGKGAFDTNPAFAFTTAARNAEDLIKAVAEVYQKFLGARRVQTGPVQGTIEVNIAALVQEAFVVIAADGPVAGLDEVSGNPGAAHVDLNHGGGGRTLGLDKRSREYRIVRLHRPAPGRWQFQVPGLQAQAGWLLLQDSAIGLRLLSSASVAQGASTRVEMELYDQSTGQRISDPSSWSDLTVNLFSDGQTVRLRDDGQEGDREAGDAVLTGLVTFQQTGNQHVTLQMESDFLDRRLELEFQVSQVDWLLQVTTPARAVVSSPVELSIQVQADKASDQLAPWRRIDVNTNGKLIASLRDDGAGGDRKARDNVFTGSWTPAEMGTVILEYLPVGRAKVQPISAPVEVVGALRFASPIPVELGRTGSNSQLTGLLDLGATEVKGDFTIELSSTYQAAGSQLEIDLGQGWTPLDAQPKLLRLTESGLRRWPLRLRVGDCPASVSPTVAFSILLVGVSADQPQPRAVTPLAVEVVADPWLHCWWPILAAAIGAVALGITLYGFWSPSRFPPRLGVVISPEVDMTEGYFHPIRAQRGSGSGFYRDARIYVSHDFRLSSKARSGLARLRADGNQVRIQSTAGASLWRQTVEGDWEKQPSAETAARFGDVYKDELGLVFFEIRNG